MKITFSEQVLLFLSLGLASEDVRVRGHDLLHDVLVTLHPKPPTEIFGPETSDQKFGVPVQVLGPAVGHQLEVRRRDVQPEVQRIHFENFFGQHFLKQAKIFCNNFFQVRFFPVKFSLLLPT